jgi:MFS family permease
MPKNNAKKWTIISAIITVIGIAMIFAGFILDDYDFFWMIMVGFMLGLTFLICFFMFVGQARRLDNMFKNSGLLVHWRFNPTEQQEKIKNEYLERKSRNKILLLIIIGFFVLFGGIFAVFGFDDFEEALPFLGIMGAVLVLICIVALAAPGSAYRKMKRSPPEVFVGPYSAWVMGEYTQWKAPMTKIRSVRFIRDENGVVIEVQYDIFQRYGYQQHECRIPVPQGSEEEARRVGMDIAGVNNIQYFE